MPILTLRAGDSCEAKINSDLGASLVQLTLGGRDVIKYPLKEDDPKKGYPSSFLFPFPNRIRDGRYTFNEQKYELEINDLQGNNAIHGLIAFNYFRIIEQTENTAILSYEYSGSAEGYPFPFKFQVSYTLTNLKLDLQIEITNTGKTSMPCGFGWHPYFGFEGNSIKDFELKLPLRYRLELDERLLPTGEKDFEKVQKIALKNSILDNIFEFKSRKGTQEIELKDSKNTLTVYQKAGLKGLNYFIIYTPPSRNSVAIEPQSCPTNAFNSEIDLEVLKPGNSWKLNFGVKLK